MAASLNLSDYLAQVEHHPALVDTAHQRIARMILQAGGADDAGHPYPFFSQHLSGIDDTLRTIVDQYFRPAAQGFDARHRILLLVGPVGSGKSSLVTLLKRGLETFTATPEGALYAIAECPMHEDPIHLLDSADRHALAERLHRPAILEGELCPLCRFRLDNIYAGDPTRFSISPITLSESLRRGIGTYAPSDPKSQDIADLTGSIDFATIGAVGAESDPRAFRFDGELNIANRGLIEFQEMLKLDERFLYHLLSLSQEGNFKTGRYQLISADEVIVGHTNLPEYTAFRENPRNAALLSRMMVVPVPYPRQAADEIRIYTSRLTPYLRPDQHCDPTLLATMAQWVITSRSEPREGSLLPAGFDGLDPRFVHDQFASAAASAGDCLTTAHWLTTVRTHLEQDPFLPTPVRTQRLAHLTAADTQWRLTIQTQLAHTLTTHAEQFPTIDLAPAYFDALERSLSDHTAPTTLMESVQYALGITSRKAQPFQQELAWGYAAFCEQTASPSAETARAFAATLPDFAQALQTLAWQQFCDTAVVHDTTLQQTFLRVFLAENPTYCPTCAEAAFHHVVTLGALE